MMKLYKKHVKDIQNNRYLYAIFRAMKEIGETYSAIITREDEKDKSKIIINERNYVIYLSYILGYLQGSKKYLRFNYNDFVNGEICKYFDVYKDNDSVRKAYVQFLEYQKLKSGKEDAVFCEIKDRRIRPDFVIHSSHKEDYEIKGQKLILEAKTTPKLDDVVFCWDLLKLHFYLNKLKFNNAVYIIVNTKMEIIAEMAEVFYSRIFPNCRNRNKLWFFVQNRTGNGIMPVNIFQIHY